MRLSARKKRLLLGCKWAMAVLFSILFLLFSLSLMFLAVVYLIDAFGETDIITGLIKSINVAFISLATFELGTGVLKEYNPRRDEEDIFLVVRRMVMRFGSVTSIALVLEGLVMVIKYSQTNMAGNLNYPVEILVAAAILLTGLGIFLALTRKAGKREKTYGLKDVRQRVKSLDGPK